MMKIELSLDFFGILVIVLAFAKLIGWISWSWWIVFAPIWFPILFGLSFTAVALLILASIYLYFRYVEKVKKM